MEKLQWTKHIVKQYPTECGTCSKVGKVMAFEDHVIFMCDECGHRELLSDSRGNLVALRYWYRPVSGASAWVYSRLMPRERAEKLLESSVYLDDEFPSTIVSCCDVESHEQDTPAKEA